MTNTQIRAALTQAGIDFRSSDDGNAWHVPCMGFGWHSTAAVVAWLQGR